MGIILQNKKTIISSLPQIKNLRFLEGLKVKVV